MMEPPVSRCPDDETLAAWIDGALPDAERTSVIEHVSACAECMAFVDAANETFHDEAQRAAVVPRVQPRRSSWWLAAAAVLLLAIPAAWLVINSRRGDPVQRLVDLSPRSSRPVEARLSGGFPWAPYRGAMRSDGAAADPEQMRLVGAAADALERERRNPSAGTQRAAAVAMVLVARPDEALERFIAETKRDPARATAWSDLAAAQYATAMSDGRTSMLPEALASADRALAVDPQLAEALFNRALILERLGLRDLAAEAWRRYLAADPSSSWAREAREHLARLSAAHDERPFDADRTALESAAAEGNEVLVRTLTSRHAERARAFAEAEYLGRWAEAMQRGDTAAATRWLTIARNIGIALERTSGESLLGDAVRAIDGADADRRSGIAAAHLDYRRGRIAFSRRELVPAERDLRLAAMKFAALQDPMSLAARSYAAGTRLAQNDVATARNELDTLVGEVDAARGYVSLGGQVRWELARALMYDGDAPGAARRLAEAESLFGRARESVNQATVGTMLADALITAGRPDEAWRAHSRAFATFTAAGREDLLDGAIGSAAMFALRAGRLDTARALVSLNESLQRDGMDVLRLADTLTRKSLLEAGVDTSAAVRTATEAQAVANRIADGALRARHLADAELAMAAALVRTDARRARELASGVLVLYGASGMKALTAEPYLIRARASLRLGDAAAARSDLEAGIRTVAEHPTEAGSGVLDAGNALFEEAIRLDLERGDVAAVFAHAERRRGSVSPSLDELRARLAGSGTAVVALIVWPREIVSLTMTEHGATVARTAIAREQLAKLIASGDDRSSAILYDLLIRPSAAMLSASRALIVVPDEGLERVAFASLLDATTGRRLVERLPVAIAPSAMLRTSPPRTRPSSLAAVELPSGREAGSAALPEAAAEVTEIASLYRAVTRVRESDAGAESIARVASSADILHIAGHTSNDDASGGASLALGTGSISARSVAAMRGVPPLVVLSACNTLRRPPDHDRRVLSLGGAFVAAGATSVFGTLAPVGDADARAIVLALHKQLALGIDPMNALRNVQLAQMGRPGGAAWQHFALLTTVIHRVD